MIMLRPSVKLINVMKKEATAEMNAEQERGNGNSPLTLVEGVDYYFEDALMVFTAHFLRRRGYCCGNSCRHCPYEAEQLVKEIP